MNNIETLRRNLDLSQEQFADKVGVTRCHVSNWETGKTTPSTANLMRMSDEFDVSTDYLLGRETAAE